MACRSLRRLKLPVHSPIGAEAVSTIAWALARGKAARLVAFSALLFSVNYKFR
jgi:hypothetical protein